jgi:hypothetical protein
VFENRVLRRIFHSERDEVTGNGGSCTMSSFIFCTHIQISLGRSVKENEVGRVHGTCGRGKKSVQGFGGKARRKETTRKTKVYRLELGIRMDLRVSGWRDVQWIRLAQERDRWRVLVNTAMNLQVLVPPQS